AAEDVFQATFLLLARKAAAVAWGPTVGPWLYQAACRLGARARSRAARRRPHAPLGPDVAAPPSDPSAGLAWAEVRAALDGGLARAAAPPAGAVGVVLPGGADPGGGRGGAGVSAGRGQGRGDAGRGAAAAIPAPPRAVPVRRPGGATGRRPGLRGRGRRDRAR